MEQNLKMVRGDTLSFAVEIEGVTNVESAYFSCKKDIDGNEYIFQRRLGSGIWKAETTDKGAVYGVRAQPSDTADLEAGNYWYDMEIGVDGDVFTILRGILTIVKDVHNT